MANATRNEERAAHHLLKTAYRTIQTGRYALPGSLAAAAARSDLERALALTVLEHGLLQPGLADEDSKQPVWIRLKSIDLKTMVEWIAPDTASNDEFLRKRLAQLHSEPFSHLETVPGWRITVVQSLDDEPSRFIDVIFSFNHASMDGISGKIFHSSLVQNLNLVAQKGPSVLSTLAETFDGRILQLPQHSKLSPIQEELMKFPVSIGFIFGAGWKGLRPGYFVPGDYAKWAPMRGTDGASGIPNETTLQLVTTDPPYVKRLLVECRRHKTTITGLMHALVFISLCQRIPSQPSFNGGSTINMRRFMSAVDTAKYKPDQMMGNYVTLMGHTFDQRLTARVRASQQEQQGEAKQAELRSIIWEVAARVCGELQDKIKRGTKNDMMGLVGMMAGNGDFRSILKGELLKDREFSWEVSNLGTLNPAGSSPSAEPVKGDGSSNGTWLLQRLVSSQGAVANGAAILVFPVSINGGAMCTTVMAQKGVVEEQLTQGLARDLETWLPVLAGDGSE